MTDREIDLAIEEAKERMRMWIDWRVNCIRLSLYYKQAIIYKENELLLSYKNKLSLGYNGIPLSIGHFEWDGGIGSNVKFVPLKESSPVYTGIRLNPFTQKYEFYKIK